MNQSPVGKGISVIVPTRNRHHYLANFLASLNTQTRLPDELIIIDASDTEDTRTMIETKDDFLPFEVIYKREAPGSARQRNIGFRISGGSYLFFFDDDVILEPDYIGTVCDTFSKHRKEQLGGITGKITNIRRDPSAWDRAFKRIFLLSDLGEGHVKLSGFPSLRIGDEPSYVEILSGCNMTYPREVFSQFLFDERLTGYSYMEDIDLSFRVGKRYPLYYQPRARLEHHPSAYRTHDQRELRKMMIQNHRYLFRKNQPQDLPHILSHWISILGVFLYNVLFQRDFMAASGVFEGLREPLNVEENL
jgi:GT2 family glycosyltransferase